jgi:hypothetical protein
MGDFKGQHERMGAYVLVIHGSLARYVAALSVVLCCAGSLACNGVLQTPAPAPDSGGGDARGGTSG